MAKNRVSTMIKDDIIYYKADKWLISQSVGFF
jgi:hypothetical protein